MKNLLFSLAFLMLATIPALTQVRADVSFMVADDKPAVEMNFYSHNSESHSYVYLNNDIPSWGRQYLAASSKAFYNIAYNLFDLEDIIRVEGFVIEYESYVLVISLETDAELYREVADFFPWRLEVFNGKGDRVSLIHTNSYRTALLQGFDECTRVLRDTLNNSLCY